MINRHNGCIGITLFRIGRRQLEIFYCPKGEVIEPHVHRNINSTLIMLGGGLDGKIGDRSGKTGWHDFLRRFHIPAGTVHSATVIGRFCLFANYEKWNGNPTSAATDFIET